MELALGCAAPLFKNIRHLAFQIGTDLLNRFEREVLLFHFQPMQGGIAQTGFTGELDVGIYQKSLVLIFAQIDHSGGQGSGPISLG